MVNGQKKSDSDQQMSFLRALIDWFLLIGLIPFQHGPRCSSVYTSVSDNKKRGLNALTWYLEAPEIRYHSSEAKCSDLQQQ